MAENSTFIPSTAPFEERFARLKELLSECSKIAFFGGAGVSTGSGIPDFRSDDGLYKNMPEEVKQYEPEYLLSKRILTEHPDVFYDFYRNHLDLRYYEPNAVHKYLAKLEEDGKMAGVITQNVDLLHEKAGSKKLFKIHGTIATQRCNCKGQSYDVNYIFDSKEPIPRCPKCHALIRPNVVFYGENLPNDQVAGALKTLREADCLIVCGTSLSVYPAASFVSEFSGKYLIIINRDKTTYENYADLVFHEDMNEVFGKLMTQGA